MSVILLVLGIMLAAAGVALIGFGIPIKELSFGPTLILAGVVALVGGLVLIGLAAVVAELARVRAALKAPLQAPQVVVAPRRPGGGSGVAGRDSGPRARQGAH